MDKSFFKEMPRFKTPEEELNFLRAHVKAREEQLINLGHIEHAQENAISDVVGEYKKIPVEEVSRRTG